MNKKGGFGLSMNGAVIMVMVLIVASVVLLIVFKSFSQQSSSLNEIQDKTKKFCSQIKDEYNELDIVKSSGKKYDSVTVLNNAECKKLTKVEGDYFITYSRESIADDLKCCIYLEQEGKDSETSCKINYLDELIFNLYGDTTQYIYSGDVLTLKFNDKEGSYDEIIDSLYGEHKTIAVDMNSKSEEKGIKYFISYCKYKGYDLDIHRCFDGEVNEDETDVDCGGEECDSCENGKNCSIDLDCESDFCEMSNDKTGICRESLCNNGNKDPDETDVDCGGDRCNKCEYDNKCLNGQDCESSICGISANDKEKKCMKNYCNTGSKDGDETDVDCGGHCFKCENGKRCEIDLDCESDFCETMYGKEGICLDLFCNTGLKDGDETDVDCGGSCRLKCEIGENCLINLDCKSANCDSNHLCSK